MRYEWDPEKDAANRLKHGIGFLTASRVFDDPECLYEDSTRLRDDELRSKAIGTVDGNVIAVVYTDRPGKRRIISARTAKRNERRQYRAGRETG